MTPGTWRVLPASEHDPDRIGPFVVLGRLGAGGMGQVYLCRSGAGRLLAVKTIRPGMSDEQHFRRRFAREVQAARRVSGVFTAAVVAADAEAEVPWMATAYIPAPSLAELVRACGPMPEPAVRWLAASVAEALESIHAEGLIHRDLKPANVLVARDGPKVIDFGIARAATRLTTVGRVLGTPAYMPPEQVRDPDGLTPAGDVYALGGVLLFAATGHDPYPGGDHVNVLYQVVHDPPNLTGVPPGLLDLVRACLDRDPARRPRPAEVVRAFAPFLEASPEPYGADGWLPEHFLAFLRGRPARPPRPVAPPATGESPAGRADVLSGFHAVPVTPAPTTATPPPMPTTPPAPTMPPGGASAPAQGRPVADEELPAVVGALAGAVAELTARIGADAPETLRARHAHAHWTGRAGDPAGAARLFAGLVTDRTRVLGNEHADTLDTRHALAYWTGRAKDPARAASLSADLAADRIRINGPDHPFTFDARLAHAQWTGHAGDAARAAELLDVLAADRSRVLGPDHHDTVGTVRTHAYWAARAAGTS